MMHPTASRLFAEVKEMHMHTIQMLVELRAAQQSAMTLEDVVDLAYAMDKCDKFLTEVAKLCRQLGTIAEKQACAQYLQSAESAMADDKDVERSIHTDHVRATPHVRMLAALPKRKEDPDRYGAMLDDLGVPRHLWEGKAHPTVEPHWPGLMDRISERLAEGKPLPRGVDPDKTYPEYSLHLYGKKGPDE